MKKSVLLLTFAWASLGCAMGQTRLAGGNETVLKSGWNLDGCNYASYFNVYDYLKATGQTKLTAAPEGYEPFYLSSFARHGSRWLGGDDNYIFPLDFMKDAAAKGVLTEKGKVLLQELKEVVKECPKEKYGVLTRKGALQHRDIASRMCANYPEIFDAKGSFFAQSSKVKRCVLSMNAAADEIKKKIGINIEQAYGRKGMQDRLAGHYDDKEMESHRGPGYKLHATEREEMTPYKRIVGELMTSTSWTTEKRMKSFVRMLFDMAQNMQSHDFDIDIWKYFIEEEVNTMYVIKNRHWYRMFGPSPTTGGLMPKRSKWQLEDIVEGADSVVNKKNWHGANLRFSHDTALMPLVCLMELGTTGLGVPESQISTIDEFFRNQEIFPMAGNIQLVFYRPKSGVGDVLVKCMLCEREVTLPGTPVTGPYYRWSEIRTHWMKRIK